MIGLFDSGYGGLTILEEVRRLMPEYDYLYLGDNARAPYGSRSFDIVYEFTWQAVRKLFDMGCPLVILACNTASAKALRSIQQNKLVGRYKDHRVLGVIRPTAECVGRITETRHVGIVATQGTIQSQSYPLEIAKLWPDIVVDGEPCPLWVPMVENYEFDNAGVDFFVGKRLRNLLGRDPKIDTLILGCTHYPLLMNAIRRNVPEGMHIIAQGTYVAESLKDYLHRHPEMDVRLTKNGECRFLTTESVEKFSECAGVFLKDTISAERIEL